MKDTQLHNANDRSYCDFAVLHVHTACCLHKTMWLAALLATVCAHCVYAS
jgi:hypothetical protein